MISDTDNRWLSAVKTDGGNEAARAFDLPEAFTEVNDAVDGVVSKVRHNYLLAIFRLI